jgi:hypothetical protein
VLPDIRVVEVDRSGRQDRRRLGKSDPLDAVSAAQSGRAAGAPKGRDGTVEAIRALMVTKRSAAGEGTQTINQARALVLTGPDELRARFTRHTRLRWWPGATPPASRCASWDGARMPPGPRPTRAPARFAGRRLLASHGGGAPAPEPSPGTSATRVHATPVACSCAARCDVSAQ